MYHKPVMLDECISGLNIKPDGVYVDVTFGGGGHSRAILDKLGPDGLLIAFDQDADAIKNAPDDERFIMVHQNFRYLKQFVRFYDALPVDGILADLGISSYQIDQAEKGFSTRFEGALDMRMDQRESRTAEIIVNEYAEEDLMRILRLYGELKPVKKIANKISSARAESRIKTTRQLIDILTPIAPRGRENKFMAQVFQSLRIEVNREMETLAELLRNVEDVLAPGGRLVVMSYHSLEDRMVKYFMRSGNLEGVIEKDFFGKDLSPFNLVSRKAIMASEEEIGENSRARSARLRVAEKQETTN